MDLCAGFRHDTQPLPARIRTLERGGVVKTRATTIADDPITAVGGGVLVAHDVDSERSTSARRRCAAAPGGPNRTPASPVPRIAARSVRGGRQPEYGRDA